MAHLHADGHMCSLATARHPAEPGCRFKHYNGETEEWEPHDTLRVLREAPDYPSIVYLHGAVRHTKG